MPTFTTSAMHPNGAYVADGMDQSDEANFNLANQRNQQSMMAQLALAQLRSGDARYAAERSDNMGMAGINALSTINGQNIGHQDRMAEMQATANRDKAQFGYLQGRDAMADKRHQQEWEYGTDPTKNAMLADQQAMNKSQTGLALAQLKELSDRQARANTAQNGAVPYTAKTTQGQLAAQNAAMGGAGLGQQGVAAQQADLPQIETSANDESAGLAQDIQALQKKSSRTFGANPSDAEVGNIQNKLDALIKHYKDAGYNDSDAKGKAQHVLRDNYKSASWHAVGSNPDPIYQLYQHLGMQAPN